MKVSRCLLGLVEFDKGIGGLEVGVDHHLGIALVGHEDTLVVLGGGGKIPLFLLDVPERQQGLRCHLTPPFLGPCDLFEDFLRLVGAVLGCQSPPLAVGDLSDPRLGADLLHRIVEPTERLVGFVPRQSHLTHPAIGAFHEVAFGEGRHQLLVKGFGLVQFPFPEGDVPAFRKQHCAELIRGEVTVDRGHQFVLAILFLGEPRQLGAGIAESRAGQRGIPHFGIVEVFREVTLRVVGRERGGGGTRFRRGLGLSTGGIRSGGGGRRRSGLGERLARALRAGLSQQAEKLFHSVLITVLDGLEDCFGKILLGLGGLSLLDLRLRDPVDRDRGGGMIRVFLLEPAEHLRDRPPVIALLILLVGLEERILQQFLGLG